MSGALGTKFDSHTRRLYSFPLPLKNSSSPEKRSLKACGLLKMNSWSRNNRIMGGALVTEMYRAGSAPLALKCWYQALSGMANRLPSCHSNVAFCFSSIQMLVAPRPETTYTVSSYMWCSGSDLPPGLISTTWASLGSVRLGMLMMAPEPPLRCQGDSSISPRSSNAKSTMTFTPSLCCQAA